MSLIINSKLIHFLWWLLAPFLVAFLCITILLMVLENKKLNTFKIQDEKMSYMYNFPKFFTTQNSNQKKNVNVTSNEKLRNLILKACYIEKNRKFIIIEERHKSIFLNLNDEYKGAKLLEVTKDSARFFKDGKYVSLSMEKSLKATKSSSMLGNKESVEENTYISVNREEIKKYKANLKAVLRDIRFQEVQEDGKFSGLRLNFIRKSSLFERMGFKKGDLIKSVDNKKLNSMMDLLPYYTSIENITTLQISFERDRQIKEITYEIN